MEPSAAAAREKAARKQYIESFANVVTAFSSANKDDLLGNIASFLEREFDAERAELWLWDASSNSGYLVHTAGVNASHKHDYISAGHGAIGRVGEAKKLIENLNLSSLGPEEQEFSKHSGLHHISCYPMNGADGKLVAVLAAYTKRDATEEQLGWWKMYAEMCSLKVLDMLTAEEQRKQITQLSLLFEATRLLNSTLDLAELLELILKIARTEVKADRGSVFLVDNQHQELWSIVASGLDHQEIRIPFGNGVAGRVAQTGNIVNVDDAYTLEYFERSFDQKFGYRTKSLLSLPIKHHTGEIVGVIQLLNKQGAAKFNAEDEDFLTKLSGHMAMALENARLHRDQLIKQRLEKELALARSIQRSLLPETPPVVPGYDIAVMNEPCFEVGGDYYDFVALGPHSLLVVVADVEGKGVASALVMSNLQATLRALVMHLHSLEVLATSLNEMIFNDTKSEKYLSCFLGLVDTRRGGLHYINCGHIPPLLVRADNKGLLNLEEGGTVIGLFPHADYKRGSTLLKPGDVMVCCTDGITEASDANDDEYGRERLVNCIRQNQEKSAKAITEAVLADVNAFSRGSKYTDDKVLMIVKVAPDGALQPAKIKLSSGPGGSERRTDQRG
jgi:phosphoserine phosphatase RsbU/P